MRRTKEEALQTRARVLQAAAHIIARSGFGAFTIDAVAQEAGVTKGGVLHHFASKDALVDGLIDQVIEVFHAHLAAELAAEPDGVPGRWLRAYIRTVFSVRYDDKSLIPALAAAITDPQRLDRIRRYFAESQSAAAEDGLEPIAATILRLAVDGLVFARALNLDVLDAETGQNVREELLRLTGSVTA